MSTDYQTIAASNHHDSNIGASQPLPETTSETNSADVDALLGLDLELDAQPDDPQAQRKRARNFSEQHLLSVRGLKYIKNNAAKKLRPRLNHRDEYKNLTNLLTYYQIWGHNLYPKANFSDFVNLCQSVGKRKSVKMLRQQWVEEDMAKDQISKLGTNEIEIDLDPNSDRSDSRDVEALHSNKQTPDSTEPNDQPQAQTNHLFVNEDDNFSDDFDDLYTALATKPSQSATGLTSTATGSTHPATSSTSQPTNITEAGFSTDNTSFSLVRDTAASESSKETESVATESALNPDRAIPKSQNNHVEKPHATDNSQNSKNNEDDFPDPNDFDDFEDEYAAEMEAMREFD